MTLGPVMYIWPSCRTWMMKSVRAGGRSRSMSQAIAERADTSIGDDTGPFGGLGLEYKVTDRFSIGGEALVHRFDDFSGSGVDIDAQTYSLRTTFRF